MTANKLIIAAAGSGKTTFLVKEALKVTNGKVLITTYTEENKAEIRKKFIIENKYIPGNITIQTWFSFLLQHGVRPFQNILFKQDIKGMILVNKRSGFRYLNEYNKPVYFSEKDNFEQHYFTTDHKIYSDKIAKFIINCNKKSNKAVLNRLTRIYSHIFIDEVQDLAGYDLDLIKLLLSESSRIVLVGDPRQVTYLTHPSQKYKKYRNGLIKDFIENEIAKTKKPNIDETTLKDSHRNNSEICLYSSKLYPDFPVSTPCNCTICRNYTNDHEGIFLVRPSNLETYLEIYEPTQLRWNKRVNVHDSYKAKNFGKSKGRDYDRVLVYPTEEMVKWIKNNSTTLANETRAKLYVAITRARFSVAFVYDFKDGEQIADTANFVCGSSNTIPN